MRIEENIQKTYEADPEALKAEWPDEYQNFLDEGGITDKAWIQDCLDAGSFDLFTLVDESYDVEIIG